MVSEPLLGVTVTYRKSHRSHDPNAWRWWDPNYDPMTGESPCPVAGTTCARSVVFNPAFECSAEPIAGYGWSITAFIPAIGYQHVNGELYIETAASGTIFEADEFEVQITSWPEHPEYIGVTIPLDGMTVAPNGTITFFIPN